MPTRRQLHVIGLAVLALALLYFGGAALLLRLDLDAILFPRNRAPAPVVAPDLVQDFRVAGTEGDALLVRRFGSGSAGCVLWFPDEDGGIERYAGALFESVARAGLVVYAVAWPGQDGAPGRARWTSLPGLAARAASAVIARCGAARTVIAGEGIGGLVAALATSTLLQRPAGLVLESVSPTFSAAVRARLRERVATRALALLPLERLLPHDEVLADAIGADLHAVAFQGTADAQAPVAELRPGAAPQGERPAVTEVRESTHADTRNRARADMIATMLDMIRDAGRQQRTATD
jgi:alpha-beta hydrolase superfamily lysophospholipase